MRYGVTLPALDPTVLGEIAHDAEAAGWDGLFVWDLILGFDAWIALAAVAMRTERLRFGTMLTPLSRRRPWMVANTVATLDALSHGRVTLPVGLGAAGPEHRNSLFGNLGEEQDKRVRAELLDESLDIIMGLWSGQPFSYAGRHYTIRDVTFAPEPVQRPRPPIWVVGAWPRMKSMRRVVRCDGVLPVKMDADRTQADMTPDDLRAMRTFIDEQRAQTNRTEPFDIVMEGETPGDDPARAAEQVRPLAAAGLTWWLESVWAGPETAGGLEGMRTRVRQGPPRPAEPRDAAPAG